MESAVYFPILRGKQGEIAAIARLSPYARSRTRPIDIPLSAGDEEEPIEYRLCDLAATFASSWGTLLPVYFDLSAFGPDERIADGRHPVEHLFDCIRQVRMHGVPVAGPESVRGPGYRYLEAVAHVARRDGRGAGLRIPHRELRRPDGLSAAISDTLQLLSLKAGDVVILAQPENLAYLQSRLNTGH